MKDVKYQLELFALYDKDAVEEKMTKMAASGWLVESPGNFLWKYRKIEPQKLQFCVTYFPDASEFDPAPTEGQQLMEEFAAKDGWKIAARFGQMQIFYSEEASPTPMETDAVVQVQNIHRAMKKNMIPTHIFMLILSILQFFFSGWQYATDPIDFLSTPYMLYMVPMWFFIALSAMSELILYYRWYIKARKTALESGLFLPLHKNHIFSWILLVLSLIMILFIATGSSLGSMSTLFYFAVVIIVTLFICGIKLFLKREGTSRKMNRFITTLSSIFLAMGLLIFMVFIIIEYDLGGKGNSVGTYDLHGWTRLVYDDPIPFSVEDMMDTNTPWSKEADCSQTILLSRQEYRQYALSEESPINGMDYTVLDVKWESLYDTCRKAVLNDLLGDDAEDHYLPVDASPWNASEAYRLYWEDAPLDTYLIFWDGRIVKFEFSWEPTEEQIAIATTKLNTK